MKEVTYKGAKITALGHDGFLVELPEANLRFVFDPYDVRGTAPADYIFVSHLHFDHCDQTSIKPLLKDGSKIIAPECCRDELRELLSNLEVVADDKKHQLDELTTYWTIPAYNINKFRTPNEVFHPRELGGVGFVVEVSTTTLGKGKKLRFYHAGDTDNIPELKELKNIDVAFLPISGTFVMTLDEATLAAEVIQPDLAIPMHFGKLLGSTAEAHRFQNLLRGKVNVAVLSTESL